MLLVRGIVIFFISIFSFSLVFTVKLKMSLLINIIFSVAAATTFMLL